MRAWREEKLPEFRGYENALAKWADGGDAPIAGADLVGLNTDAILDTRCCNSARRPVREIYDALLGAAGLESRCISISPSTRPPTMRIADNVGWLDFTHALTFANAARQLCEETPALWPQALLQMALFVGRNAKYVRGEDDGRWAVADRADFLAARDGGALRPRHRRTHHRLPPA